MCVRRKKDRVTSQLSLMDILGLFFFCLAYSIYEIHLRNQSENSVYTASFFNIITMRVFVFPPLLYFVIFISPFSKFRCFTLISFSDQLRLKALESYPQISNGKEIVSSSFLSPLNSNASYLGNIFLKPRTSVLCPHRLSTSRTFVTIKAFKSSTEK